MSVDIAIRVKMEQLEKDLRQMGTKTEEEIKGIVRATGRGWKQTERQAARAARNTERVFKERMQGLRRVSANTFGPMTEDIADAVEAATMFGPAGIIAGASLAAIAGGLLAVGGATWAMWELVSGARAANEELEKYNAAADLQARITSDQRVAMDEFDAAIRGTGLSLQRVRIEVANELTPAWRDFATLLLAGAIALGDMTPQLLQWAGSARGAVLEAEGLNRVLMGISTLGASEVVGRPLAGAMDSLADAVDNASASGDGYLDRAKAMIASIQETDRELKAEAETWDKKTEKVRAATKAITEHTEATWKMIDLSDEFAADERERQATRAEGARLIAAQAAQDIADLEARKAAQMDLARAASAGAIEIASAAGLGAKGVATAKLLEAIAYQAAAIGRAFAEGGPIAGPALAATAIGAIAPAIASLVAAMGGGGGGASKGASGGGGGGGGGGSRRRSSRSRGSRSRGSGDGVNITMQYEHRGFGKFFDDFDRGRGRARTPRDKRSWAGR